jgi:glycerol-3-phosphate acyltransferase PlsY
MSWLSDLSLCALAGYLCGSLPFGYLAGRVKGIDRFSFWT